MTQYAGDHSVIVARGITRDAGLKWLYASILIEDDRAWSVVFTVKFDANAAGKAVIDTRNLSEAIRIYESEGTGHEEGM